MADTHAHATTHGAVDSGVKHPYHLVEPSPWPLAGAFSAGLMAVGGVVFMHGGGALLLILGFLAVLTVMALWWRDVIKEAFVQKAHSAVVKIGLRYGMTLFIASEVMFFVAFFWAFFNASLFPTAAIGHVWPPKGISPPAAFSTPFLMTLILLLSGTTVTWAHHETLEGNRKAATKALLLTVLLGLSFTCFQVFEYAHAEFGFRQGIFPSTFFMATGFHGFHVIIGTLFLIVTLGRTIKGHFTPDSHFGFEASAWYWHFVDVVWLFLFVCVYWWGGSTPAAAS